jgi:hypothetical protein
MVNLLSLLDDIVATLDDVSVMTKIALKKTSALMSDDLAVNAGVVVGVTPNRELPIVWKIFLGSLVNKIICIAGVMALLALLPIALQLILVAGGLYLSYEGAHKVHEKLFHKKVATAKKKLTENQKVWGAIRTDLVLSVEIIVIAKNSMTGSMMDQFLSLILVGIAASVLIYGLVALVVKVDDIGLVLVNRGYHNIGSKMVLSMPYIMRILGVLGTVAMLMVGGGIIGHAFHLPMITLELLQNLVLGLLVGTGILFGFETIKFVKQRLQ